ncbi:hypothetical protein ODZ84_17610 [Chryseobacterium fluminis]|uniref:hypothetical protein n=1 Tax=Chryseobacterium fluminis TaxID=2983606 RepID=UPI00224F645F|nr:hypothetical protein [Chryseobacterium sp. MMS21-Ot14]UZT97002.1 hypothetical protein ODZ84_17610 [Chryseobacterium sp. MMS21-Ot14]
MKLSDPQPGEWRYSRSETFQTFAEFQKTRKIIPVNRKNIIYLQPIGKFNDLQQKEIVLTREYLKAYFQLETKILPILSNNIFPKSVKRIFRDAQGQVLAGYVLDSILMNRKPDDAVVVMGITERDLFPKPEWNYVFGLASHAGGVG